jgi:hypothetical protein
MRSIQPSAHTHEHTHEREREHEHEHTRQGEGEGEGRGLPARVARRAVFVAEAARQSFTVMHFSSGVPSFRRGHSSACSGYTVTRM